MKKSFVFDLNAADVVEFSEDDLSSSTFSNESDIKYQQKQAECQKKLENSSYLTGTDSCYSNSSNRGKSESEPTIVRF